MDLSEALDNNTVNTQQSGGPAWPGQPANPTWPGQPSWPGQQPGQPSWPGQQPGQPSWPGQQPGQPSWPGQQPGQPSWPGQQPGMPGQPAWPGPPNQPSAPGWGGPVPPTSPQNAPPLTVPYELQLPSGIYNKMLITIQGTVKPQAKRFAVNLQGKDNLAFHFNPRFNELGRQVIVRNSMVNNKWGTEERNAPSFPFGLGQPFELKILCTTDEFKVAVNKAHLLEYKYRVRELKQITQLCIYEDVTLTFVNVETLP